MNINGLIWTDAERMSGAPCFERTRVPIRHLFEYVEAGESLESFFDGFEGGTREQAIGVLELARRGLLEDKTAAG